MADCGSLSGMVLGCRGAVGVETAYIGIYTTATTFLETVEGTIDGYTGETLYQYEVQPDSSTAVFNPKANLNGTFYTEQIVTLMISKLDASARNEIMLLGQHPKLLIIVKFVDGTYWLFGEDKGIALSDSEATAGTAPDDFRGYTLNFTSNNANQPKVVETAVVTAAIA